MIVFRIYITVGAVQEYFAWAGIESVLYDHGQCGRQIGKLKTRLGSIPNRQKPNFTLKPLSIKRSFSWHSKNGPKRPVFWP